MIVFNVIKEPHGWAIRLGEGVTTPFRSMDSAICAASSLADAIRRHGACVEIIVEGGAPTEPPAWSGTSNPGGAPPRRRWRGAH